MLRHQLSSGARAANGVVLVKTKSGQQGRPVVAYNGAFSLRNITKHLDLLTPREFVDLQMEINPLKYAGTYFKEGKDASGTPYRYQSIADYDNIAGIDWQKEAFKPTWSQKSRPQYFGWKQGNSICIVFLSF